LLERAIAGAWQLWVHLFYFCVYIMKSQCACHNFVGQSYWILLAFFINVVPAQIIMKPNSVVFSNYMCD
jgi:hypothetical protein